MNLYTSASRHESDAIDYACSVTRPPRGYGRAWWTAMALAAVALFVWSIF